MKSLFGESSLQSPKLSLSESPPTFDGDFRVFFIGAIRRKSLFAVAGVAMALAECADTVVLYRIASLLESAERFERAALVRLARLLAMHFSLALAGLPFAARVFFALNRQLIALKARVAVEVGRRALAFGRTAEIGSVASLVQNDCERLANCVSVIVIGPKCVSALFINFFWVFGYLAEFFGFIFWRFSPFCQFRFSAFIARPNAKRNWQSDATSEYR